MKAIVTTLFILTLFSSAFAKAPEDKTFLILLDKDELRDLKSSPEYIELSFHKIFTTKSYSGNSEYAIIMTIPNCNMNTVDIGQLLVQVNGDTTKKLEDVALRIVDLDESKSNYRAILANLDSKSNKKKKDRNSISLSAN